VSELTTAILTTAMSTAVMTDGSLTPLFLWGRSDQYTAPMDAAPHAPASEPLVRVTDLTLTVPSAAGPVHILRGVDLSIARGEAVALVGPSGSGKTSLLMVMAGLERASGGSVVLDGQTVTALTEDGLSRLRRERVGIIFQAFHLI